ncbi:MAG: hypothetical protein K2P93_03860 [Alphaproteobacteria bacterium]|nr:hypothetical protein [Alphaproteobacteria bacterium]
MRINTSQLLLILRNTTITTLVCLSSTLVHAMEEDYSKSKTPSILPQFEETAPQGFSPPSTSVPLALPKDEKIIELERELALARLQRQIAEERRKALAEEELLAAESSARSTGAQQSSPPPVDPFVSLLTAFGGGHSQAQVTHNINTELSRLGESFSNLLNKGKFKHNKRLEKETKKKQQKAASTSSPSIVRPSPSIEPNSSHPIRTSSLSQLEEDALPQQEDVPLSFNPSFQTTSPGAIPKGYQFVADPAQENRKWGPRSTLQDKKGKVKLEGDGYVFYYKLTKEEIAKFAGQELIFSAKIKSNIPGAYIQYWDYPNPVKTLSAPNKEKDKWETLKLKFKVDPNQQQYFLYPAILPAIEGSEVPKVEVKDVRLRHNIIPK